MRSLVATIGLVTGCGDVLGLDTVEAPTAEPPMYVRSASVAHGGDEGNFSEVDVGLSTATRGDLIVVAVCFVDGTIASVSDAEIDAYSELPNKSASGGLHAELFWTEVASTQTQFNVRVLFEDMSPGSSPDVRIAEYQNVMFPNPVENSGGNTAADSTTLSLDIMVSQAPALVFAATCVGAQTGDVGNFSIHENTSPNGDVIADLTVTQTGPITVTATQAPDSSFILQLVAIKGGTPP